MKREQQHHKLALTVSIGYKMLLIGFFAIAEHIL